MKNFRSGGFTRKYLALTVLVLAILACSFELPTLPGAPTAQVPLPVTVSPSAEPTHQTGLTKISMQVGYGVRGPFYELYFTDPLNPAAWREEGGLDKPLTAAIDKARLSVDVAAYSVSLYSFQAALIRAHNRGVQVRMVMESDSMFDSVPLALQGAGIPIVGDRREGLMHDKFIIIDGSEVWMGSMNFTTSGTYADNNNLVRIRSDKVVEDYTVEFNEMFKDDFFGPDAIAQTPNPRLTVDGVPLEVYFSPDDHVARRIVELLRSAQQSIYFMAYSFTANDFGEILLQKARDGLTVSGVMDESQVKSNKGTEFIPFTEAGLPVYLDGNAGLLHHKVFIIDEQIVITGSYNFSASAERTNDENVVIFFDPQIASQYMAEFWRVEAQAQK
jgi:phosphatidylserine/phosphatidylglycerophosphate/cardiolipin synthase-like enzyme